MDFPQCDKFWKMLIEMSLTEEGIEICEDEDGELEFEIDPSLFKAIIKNWYKHASE